MGGEGNDKDLKERKNRCCEEKEMARDKFLLRLFFQEVADFRHCGIKKGGHTRHCYSGIVEKMAVGHFFVKVVSLTRYRVV